MSRIVQGLVQAEVLSERPKCIPVSRPRAAGKKAGLRYERALGRQLPQAQHGKWFRYMDYEGWHYCQPDYILPLGDEIVILECKYTWTPEAYMQIEGLYVPVVGRALGRPTWGVQVCKRLLPASRSSVIRGDLASALVAARQGHRACLHWLGDSPLMMVSAAQRGQKEASDHARLSA